MRVIRTAHSGAILTLTELKSALNLNTSAYDTRLTGIIATVTERLDGQYGVLNSTVLPTTWEAHFNGFPNYNHSIVLPYPPIQTLVSVEYDNESGQAVDYTTKARLCLTGRNTGLVASYEGWPTDVAPRPTTEPVRVTFTAGYAQLPASIKQVATALAASMFDNPSYYSETSVRRNPQYMGMLQEYRY